MNIVTSVSITSGYWIHCTYCGGLVFKPTFRYKPKKFQFCNKVCAGKWKFNHGLQEKMHSAFNAQALPKYYPELIVSRDLAYIVGVLIGDGSVGNRAIRFCTKDKPFANSFSAAMHNIGLPTKILRHTRYDKPKPLTTFDIQIRSSLFIAWYGQADFTLLAKQFPAAFTRGFYESEGYWGHCIFFCNSDLLKLELVQSCLIDLGFRAYPIKQYIYPERGNVKNKKPMYQFSVSMRDKVKFLDVISPCIKRGEQRR